MSRQGGGLRRVTESLFEVRHSTHPGGSRRIMAESQPDHGGLRQIIAESQADHDGSRRIVTSWPRFGTTRGGTPHAFGHKTHKCASILGQDRSHFSFFANFFTDIIFFFARFSFSAMMAATRCRDCADLSSSSKFQALWRRILPLSLHTTHPLLRKFALRRCELELLRSQIRRISERECEGDWAMVHLAKKQFFLKLMRVIFGFSTIAANAPFLLRSEVALRSLLRWLLRSLLSHV